MTLPGNAIKTVHTNEWAVTPDVSSLQQGSGKKTHVSAWIATTKLILLLEAVNQYGVPRTGVFIKVLF